MVNLKEYGFEQLGNLYILSEGIYRIIATCETISNPFGVFKSIPVLKKLECYAENKDGEMILLGEIEGEESLKTILNLIKL